MKKTNKWTSSQILLFERGDLRPKSWISINPGMIYISRSPGGRSYWVLSKIPYKAWPKFRWSEKNIRINKGSL